MTIPTQEIQALRDRAQEALDPLPYQKARLLPVLRRDRPVRFAAVEVDGGFLLRMLDSMPVSVVCLTRGDFSTANDGIVAHWPAAQIVELCDAVLERRASRNRSRLERVRPHVEAGEVALPRRGVIQEVAAAFRFETNMGAIARLSAQAKRAADRIREQISAANHRAAREQVIASLGLPPGIAAPGTPARLKTALLDLPFVDSVQVEENCTLDTVDGMPPKSVRVTVGPKLQENERRQVAEAIDGELPIGIETCSTAGHGWCVIVGDRTIQFNEAAAHCGDSRTLAVKAIRPMAKVSAVDGVKAGGVDFATEPERTTVSTFEITESGPVLADVQEHRKGYGSGGTGLLADDVAAAEANIKRALEAAEPDGRIHYTDDPPRALKEAMDEAVRRKEARRAKRELAQIDSTVKGERFVGYITDDLVSKPDPRERLRREMTKGRW